MQTNKTLIIVIKSDASRAEFNENFNTELEVEFHWFSFLIIKILVKIKYANIINIAANEEIIPELLQSKCNAKNIYKVVDEFLNMRTHF